MVVGLQIASSHECTLNPVRGQSLAVWQSAFWSLSMEFSNSSSIRLSPTAAQRACLSWLPATRPPCLRARQAPRCNTIQLLACVQVIQVLLALRSCSCVSSMLLSVHQVGLNLVISTSRICLVQQLHADMDALCCYVRTAVQGSVLAQLLVMLCDINRPQPSACLCTSCG
jgi:hypothetical protein